MNDDYPATRFKDAERELKKALKLCGKRNCSSAVVARIQRDLGVVYLGGQKKSKPARAAFERAIQADPEIRLDRDLATPEIEQAWKDAGGEVEAPPPPEEKVELEPKPAPPKPEPEPADDRVRANYLSLSLQQDFLYHGRDDNACRSGNYSCFDGSNAEYAGPIWPVYGNQVAPGVGTATTRVMLGYDRLFVKRILAGARLGIAFGGAPTPSSGDKFLPLHLELRGSYFFGKEPFARRGLRPYAGLGLGIAEVDGSVGVDYYTDQQDYDAGGKERLVGWRKTGKAFVAPTAGAQYAFGAASAVALELRPMLMLGTSAFAPAVNIGYVHGI